MVQPFLAGYSYFARFHEDSSMGNVAAANGLYRSLGSYHEAKYRGHGVWSWSGDLSEAREHDSRYGYREVTPDEVELLRQRIDAERTAPPSPPQEDVGALALLEARRRAEPVDGHHYFAEFDLLADVVDLARAHALVRCPAEGDGPWEAYVHKGVWTRAEEPQRNTALPIGRAAADRVARAREAATTRYFRIWTGPSNSYDLVRHTGTADEVVDDLGWRSADVFRLLDPAWRVKEYSESGFAGRRYFSTTAARSDRFGDRENDYFAVFRHRDDVYDFDKVLFVMRRFYNPYYDRYEGSAYERWTPDGWKPTESPISLGFHGLLPISDEEFDRLTAPRP